MAVDSSSTGIALAMQLISYWVAARLCDRRADFLWPGLLS